MESQKPFIERIKTPKETNLEMQIKKNIEISKEILPEMKDYYKCFHERPELGGQEIETSKKVLQVLESYEIEIVEKNIGLKKESSSEKKEGFTHEAFGTGIIAIIRGQEGGKTVALRADMDALPIIEDPSNPIVSKVPGKMHACGHDIHTAALLGAAKMFKEMANKGELPGDVVLIFQPSEEKTHQKESGAVQMVKSLEKTGLREKIGAFFGQHITSIVERGIIHTREGLYLPSSGEVDIRLEGKGGHVADIYNNEIPNLNIISSQISIRLHDIFKSLYKEKQSLVANTSVEFAPKGYNVMPSTAESTFVVRVNNEEYRPITQEILSEIKTVVQEVVDEYASGTGKVKVVINPRMGYRPVIHRDSSLVNMVKDAGKLVFDKPKFIDQYVPGGEDFSFYLEKFRGKEIPGVYFFVGGANPEKGIPKGAHHTKNFKVDPDVLQEMASLHVALSLDFLSQNKNNFSE